MSKIIGTLNIFIIILVIVAIYFLSMSIWVGSLNIPSNVHAEDFEEQKVNYCIEKETYCRFSIFNYFEDGGYCNSNYCELER